MRFHYAVLVTQAEVEGTVVRQDPPELLYHCVRVNHMLIYVIEHNRIEGSVRERQPLAVAADEGDPLAEPFLGLAQPGDVNVDSGYVCSAGLGEFIGDKT